ncbi:hypothetical protein Y1Q_0019642 [Alligator mississippiensis]|uniref:Uncharacterized protein n=1 Tax=Alligator mississippiensis TaxID=8496 RepID=A0A151PF07_ALLMI|nr:hypothetical protein Y1Q_0019642 [Alligator mississippiensis]
MGLRHWAQPDVFAFWGDHAEPPARPALDTWVLKQLFSSLGTGPTDRVVSSIASQALGNCKEMTWSLLKPK